MVARLMKTAGYDCKCIFFMKDIVYVVSFGKSTKNKTVLYIICTFKFEHV